MESLAKILEFVGKYAWAVCITTAFLLFIPQDAAEQVGVFEIRTAYKGLLWIIFILTLVLTIGAVLQYIDRRIFDGWLKRRHDARTRAESKQREVEIQAANELKELDAIAFRLQSLDRGEKMWLKYCLYHNVQTLSAQRADRIAQSLCHKGIVEEGTGSILDLPFHFPDRIWKYLIEHKQEFLLESEMKDSHFPDVLNQFRKSLWVDY
jgi:hypothetical protein